MPDPKKIKHADFTGQVHDREIKKIRARENKSREVWFGLGMFGMVGWAVTVPMVLCIFCGVWIDMKWPGRYSWTLMFLMIGIILGCVNGWYWISRERRTINREREKNGD